METLKIFENPEFGKIRTVLDEQGNILFCASDVAQALAYKNYHAAIRQHCKGVRVLRTPLEKNAQSMNFIPESDVYRLIIRSKLPTAQKFEAWVCEEILPSIRKHGGYVTWEKVQEFFTNPASLSEFLRQMLKITDENESLKTQLEILTPKADYYDKLMNSNHLINFRNTATALGVRPLYFINYLVDRKYIYHNTKNEILPYQEHMQAGIFELVEYRRNGHFGVQTLITPKGRHHFLQCYFNGEMDAGLV